MKKALQPKSEISAATSALRSLSWMNLEPMNRALSEHRSASEELSSFISRCLVEPWLPVSSKLITFAGTSLRDAHLSVEAKIIRPKPEGDEIRESQQRLAAFSKTIAWNKRQDASFYLDYAQSYTGNRVTIALFCSKKTAEAVFSVFKKLPSREFNLVLYSYPENKGGVSPLPSDTLPSPEATSPERAEWFNAHQCLDFGNAQSDWSPPTAQVLATVLAIDEDEATKCEIFSKTELKNTYFNNIAALIEYGPVVIACRKKLGSQSEASHLASGITAILAPATVPDLDTLTRFALLAARLYETYSVNSAESLAARNAGTASALSFISHSLKNAFDRIDLTNAKEVGARVKLEHIMVDAARGLLEEDCPHDVHKITGIACHGFHEPVTLATMIEHACIRPIEVKLQYSGETTLDTRWIGFIYEICRNASKHAPPDFPPVCELAFFESYFNISVTTFASKNAWASFQREFRNFEEGLPQMKKGIPLLLSTYENLARGQKATASWSVSYGHESLKPGRVDSFSRCNPAELALIDFSPKYALAPLAIKIINLPLL